MVSIKDLALPNRLRTRTFAFAAWRLSDISDVLHVETQAQSKLVCLSETFFNQPSPTSWASMRHGSGALFTSVDYGLIPPWTRASHHPYYMGYP